MLLTSLSSLRENREFVMRGWSGLEFSILRDWLPGVLDAFCFPRENWEFVNRGLGDAEFAILRMGKRTRLVILQRAWIPL